MSAGQKEQTDTSSDQSKQHIGLGVPDIALGAEKCFRSFVRQQGNPPFDQLVKSADGQADTEDKKVEPLP